MPADPGNQAERPRCWFLLPLCRLISRTRKLHNITWIFLAPPMRRARSKWALPSPILTLASTLPTFRKYIYQKRLKMYAAGTVPSQLQNPPRRHENADCFIDTHSLSFSISIFPILRGDPLSPTIIADSLATEFFSPAPHKTPVSIPSISCCLNLRHHEEPTK